MNRKNLTDLTLEELRRRALMEQEDDEDQDEDDDVELDDELENEDESSDVSDNFIHKHKFIYFI